MRSKINGITTKKSGTQSSKSDENILANQVITVGKKTNHQEMTTATTAYYSAFEKCDDFKGNEIDAVQDWFETEMEIDSELDVFDVDERDFQFLKNKIE